MKRFCPDCNVEMINGFHLLTDEWGYFIHNHHLFITDENHNFKILASICPKCRRIVFYAHKDEFNGKFRKFKLF